MFYTKIHSTECKHVLIDLVRLKKIQLLKVSNSMRKICTVLICFLSITTFGQPNDTTEITVLKGLPRVVLSNSNDIFGGETRFALGNFAWMEFVNRNMEYPKRALKKNVQGTVKAKFRLTRNGEIRFVRIVGKRLGKGTTKETKRIVKLSKHGWWIKENEKGRAKPSKGTAYVEFKLNVELK
jgi:hypothetical protein